MKCNYCEGVLSFGTTEYGYCCDACQAQGIYEKMLALGELLSVHLCITEEGFTTELRMHSPDASQEKPKTFESYDEALEHIAVLCQTTTANRPMPLP